MSRPETSREHDLPVEDDWFATPDDEAFAPYEEPRPYDEEAPAKPPERESHRGGDNRPLLLLGGIAVVVILIIAGVLIARAVSGSDGEETTSVPTIETTTTTTEPVTPPPAATTTEPVAPAPATTPSPAAATLPEGVTVRPGDTGESVTALQEALIQLGYDPGPADGDFGPATTEALIAFQQSAAITADGVAGPETLAALSEALATG
jgi:hypothetical protein